MLLQDNELKKTKKLNEKTCTAKLVVILCGFVTTTLFTQPFDPVFVKKILINGAYKLKPMYT